MTLESGAACHEACQRAEMTQRNSNGRIHLVLSISEDNQSNGATEKNAELRFRYQNPMPDRHALQKIMMSASLTFHIRDRTICIPNKWDMCSAVHVRSSQMVLLTKIKSFGLLL